MNELQAPKEWLNTLETAEAVTVMTGAGMSAESGIPTFRDPQSGLWARFRPEELASPEAFEAQPETVWKWYQWRRAQIRRASPHAGHHALATLVSTRNWRLITQNVDGLHQQTGLVPIEFHGNIWREHCQLCGKDHASAPSGSELPVSCPCGGLLRPSVVWFGETIPAAALAESLRACECDVFLVIGSSSQVYPAATLASEAAQHGAKVLVMNPDMTPVDGALHWKVAASTGLGALSAALQISE